MTLSIISNQALLVAPWHLSGTQPAVPIPIQPMSSGLRLNSAKDDAAGLAIERYTAQIRGNEQAARHANDGIWLLHNADAALATTAGNLQRIRELAVVATDQGTPIGDRKGLQAEITQLADEIERISSTTKFNGNSLFDQGRESAVGDTRQLALLDGRKFAVGWLENGERLIRELFGPAAGRAKLEKIHGANDRVAADIAANGDDVGFAIGAINLGALGLEGKLDVIGRPAQVMDATDRALAHVGSERARVGAHLSRFESTIGSLQDGTQIQADSRPRIQDADFATETTTLSSALILHGVGSAMVAQANQHPSAVLAVLLR